MTTLKKILENKVLSEEDKALLIEMGWDGHEDSLTQETEDEFEDNPETYWRGVNLNDEDDNWFNEQGV